MGLASLGTFAWPILGGGVTVFLFFTAFFHFLIAMDAPSSKQAMWAWRAIGLVALGLVWSVCWLYMTVQCLIAWISYIH